MTARVDVLLVSLGTTRGLKTADRAFIELLEGAGASVAATGTPVGADRPPPPAAGGRLRARPAREGPGPAVRGVGRGQRQARAAGGVRRRSGARTWLPCAPRRP